MKRERMLDILCGLRGGITELHQKTATRRPPRGWTASVPSHQPSSCSAIQGIETSERAAATA